MKLNKNIRLINLLVNKKNFKTNFSYIADSNLGISQLLKNNLAIKSVITFLKSKAILLF